MSLELITETSSASVFDAIRVMFALVELWLRFLDLADSKVAKGSLFTGEGRTALFTLFEGVSFCALFSVHDITEEVGVALSPLARLADRVGFMTDALNSCPWLAEEAKLTCGPNDNVIDLLERNMARLTLLGSSTSTLHALHISKAVRVVGTFFTSVVEGTALVVYAGSELVSLGISLTLGVVLAGFADIVGLALVVVAQKTMSTTQLGLGVTAALKVSVTLFFHLDTIHVTGTSRGANRRWEDGKPQKSYEKRENQSFSH